MKDLILDFLTLLSVIFIIFSVIYVGSNLLVYLIKLFI